MEKDTFLGLSVQPPPSEAAKPAEHLSDDDKTFFASKDHPPVKVARFFRQLFRFGKMESFRTLETVFLFSRQ
jgi:hypothetical protein